MRIEVEGLTVVLGDNQILRKVDLQLADGEQVAVLGPSGAGKTTLFRALLGGVPLAAGRIRIGGHDPFGSRAELARIRRATGCVRQRDDLIAGLTARANTLMATTYQWRLTEWLAVLAGRVPRRYTAPLRELTDRHGITPHLERRVEHLSGGQRQRVALVRAVLPGPRLLLADESTSGLDPVRAETVLEHLEGTAATLLVSTHDLQIARRFGRVIALREGRIVFDGPELDARAVEDIYGTAGSAAR
ncbi:ATP-binding cassette domain-containing protein [Actinomadura sp. 3N508]|uniref:ATP-binding cassette domain-containing protein n=1 Tax=Actinomadura sp. 3N508 TaxID=3375153 RepID=UPI0037AF950A